MALYHDFGPPADTATIPNNNHKIVVATTFVVASGALPDLGSF